MRTNQGSHKKSAGQKFNASTVNPLESRPFAVQPKTENTTPQTQGYESSLLNFAILNPEAGQSIPTQPQLAIKQPTEQSEQISEKIGAPGIKIQRMIKVDEINNGEPFDKGTVVDPSWGLSSGGKSVFQKWVKDDDDHHYETTKAVIEAIEAAFQPTTDNFAKIFADTADENNIDAHWLEHYLTEKENVLGFLKLESADNLVETINKWQSDANITKDDITKMSLGELVETLLENGILSQSCGQTANLIHELLSPTTAAQAPEPMNLASITSSIKTANDNSVQEAKHYYVKVEGGGHALVIEVFNDTCKIYQSFFGRYTLAKDIERNKQYSIGNFIPLLEKALSETALNEQASSEVTKARQDLFSSAAVHPEKSFKINIFTQEKGAKKRTQEKLDERKSQWDEELPNDAASYLATDEELTEQDQVAPPISVMNYDFSTISSIMVFTGYTDEQAEKGEVPIGTTALYNKITYKLVEKTATNYVMNIVK